MVLKKRIIVALTTLMSMVVLFFCATNVQAARVDMVDVSNNNGAMTVSNFKDMHDNYGVKARLLKLVKVHLSKIQRLLVILQLLNLLDFMLMVIIMLDIVVSVVLRRKLITLQSLLRQMVCLVEQF